MCATCGCGSDLHQHDPGHDHAHHAHDHHAHDHHHDHAHDHAHDHHHDHAHDHHHDHAHDHHHDHAHDHHEHGDPGRTIAFEQAVLAHNQHLAAHNRDWLRAHDVVAVNLMSSPGAGKTTLLERTLARLGGRLPLAVLEGDQETEADAERIRAAGGRALQINTGTGCHLDAAMVGRALPTLAPRGGLLFIENVGNLVCPALFDLGEAVRVVIASVTEGVDKPLKYPHMFRAADWVLLNKIDLLPHVDFAVERFTAATALVNPRARVLPLSARTGEGLDAWLALLSELARAPQAVG
jgi:hydrogenase nickel incorporation protein HypB